MGQFEEDFHKEQSRINDVVKKMKIDLSLLENQSSTVKSDIIEIRKNFWEDVTVNMDDAVEAGETATSIKQQAEFLAEHEHRHKHLDRDKKNLKRLIHTPYFARIDFKEDGEQEVESFYLGIASYLDRETDEFLVYDWRAPISSLYYDYSLGLAKFSAPAGEVCGELFLKRQFIIKDSVIEGMFDTGLTIGDELLKEVLGRQSNTQMKSIVATIQKEQNKIIRNEKGKLLIVQGAAGSGKTSAALQRVAFLLYKYRESLNSEEILLFSPNPMFNGYIRNVLPELGEENMQQTTFQQYIEHVLADKFAVEDAFSQMEYMLTAREDHSERRRISANFKSSSNFKVIVDKYLHYLSKQGLIFNDILFASEIIIRSTDIYNYFYSLPSELSITNRLLLVSEWLLSEVKKREKDEIKKPWVEEEIQYLSKEEYQFYFQKLSKQKRFSQDTFDDYEREQQLLSKYVVKRKMSPVRKSIKTYQFLNFKEIYMQMFTLDMSTLFKEISISESDWQEICTFTLSELNSHRIPYEDATPYLYLQEKIEGFRTNTRVKYVFIDEAQDYSKFQFEYIKNLFPNARFTVLGDINQAIYTHQAYTGFEGLEELFVGEHIEKIILNRSYRSTKQIIEFTSAMLENKNEIEPFNRQGNKPQIIQKRTANEIISGITEKLKISDSNKTIAIICKTQKECNIVYEKLKESELNINLITKRSNQFEEGIVIIPAYLAKGIEFDMVIICNGSISEYGNDELRKLFYTACTRAMHELIIYFTGEVSPFIKEIPKELYEEVLLS
ncbi:RNA polymerase recycling motor HelD [Metabacillus malikii]|uniref:DNA helicase-2/ATP-dependent DNA helicase PcrA n=1 Tax=Metabacillus malikii TaxID=1504265 RepID=A0ABT9Z9L0_9BACI|nr:RNA polymerase recycling motor HelD [Metabacillus malikii]MDQ0228943.1 DNA helicase-2/ATP-dependent DNA helicase PcrA [Metabacillus malikii]